MKENEKIIIDKIKNYAIQAKQFRAGMDFLEFSNDAKTIAACVFNLSQIGELASKLENDFVENTGHIPWRKIKGMRNRIVHDYEGVQLNIIWDVLVDFIPELIDNINDLE